MNLQEFQKLSQRTMPLVDTPLDLTRSNYAMGLAGEAGEVVDLIKKHVHHGHERNLEFMLKLEHEIGDVMHYLAGICTLYGIDFEECLELNISKLKKRYPEGFSTERSVNRVD